MSIAAAFDLDGTLLSGNSSFAFVRYLTRIGFFSRRQFAFCAAAFVRHRWLGGSLLSLHTVVFNHLFRGLSIVELERHLATFLDTHLESMLYAPAIEILRQSQQAGHSVYIFSNSPSFIVAPIGSRLGVENVVASRYSTDDKQCLCKLDKLVDGLYKSLCFSNLEESTRMAFSDSYLDIPFLEAATRAYVVKPDRRLRHEAKKRGWQIV